MMWNFLIAVMLAASASGTEAKDIPLLERLAKGGAESVLSRLLDTSVVVDRLQLDLEGQYLELSGLSIANPKGYEGEQAIQVETVRIEADVKSLFSDSPLVHLARLSGVHVQAEANLKGRMNLKELLDRVSRFKGVPKMLRGPEKRWRIKRGLFESGEIALALPLLKQPSSKTIDSFEMSLMGKDDKGVTAAEAMTEILKQIVNQSGLLGDSPLQDLLFPR